MVATFTSPLVFNPDWVNPFVNQQELAWLAGWIEGEGCFQYNPKNFALRTVVQCTDLDIVQKAFKLIQNLGLRKVSISGPIVKEAPRKPTWRLDSYGIDSEILMWYLKPLMGQRRQEAIQNCLEKRSNQEFKPELKICDYELCRAPFFSKNKRQRFCSKGYCRGAAGVRAKRLKQKELN